MAQQLGEARREGTDAKALYVAQIRKLEGSISQRKARSPARLAKCPCIAPLHRPWAGMSASIRQLDTVGTP